MDPLVKAGHIRNEGLDPREFFPQSSAFADDQGRVESILHNLENEGVYDQNDGHWKLPEGQMSSEQKWTQIFDRILYHASLQRCPEWSYMQMVFAWVSHEKTFVDGLRKPDIILVPKHYKFRQDVPFSAVLTYTEVKETNNKQNADLAVQQLRDVAGFAMSCQINRDYFVGSVLTGRSLKIVLCARDATYCSTPIDIDVSPKVFIRAIIALSAGYAETLGFDPLFRVDQNGCWTIELGGRCLTITRRLFLRSVDMTGRGTRVLLCRDEENKPYILKDSWVPDGEPDEIFVDHVFKTRQPNPLDSVERATEIFGVPDRFNVFHGCSSWSVRDYHFAGIPTISYVGYATQTSQLIRDRFSSLRDSLGSTRRKHLRVLSETCGVPISWFSCRREFLNAIMCVVIAHLNGTRHDLLHCDISEGNIWLCVEDPEDEEKVILPWCKKNPGEFPKHPAILGDWGKAKYYGPSSHDFGGTAPGGSITGSYPFMSAEMASQAGVEGLIPNSTIHDLESLFWVMWIVSVNTTGPYNSRRKWLDKPDPNTGFLGSTRRLDGAGADDLEPPTWATPGIHPVSLSEIHNFKSSIPQRQFLGAMTSYWKDGQSGQVFQNGMRKLREHFEWTEVSDRKFESPRTITHRIFIDILKDMRDNIPPEQDRQTMASVQQARERYGEMLADISRDISTGLLDQSSRTAIIGPSTSGSKRKAKQVPGSPDGSKRTRVGGGQAWGEDPSGSGQDEDRGAGEASASTSHPEAGKVTATASPQKSKLSNFSHLRKFKKG